MSQLIRDIEKPQLRENAVTFNIGDTLRVHCTVARNLKR